MLRISWSTQTLAFAENGDLTSAAVEHTLGFDAVTKEIHAWSATLTEHAVEEGAALSDHKLVHGDKLTLEVEVTNTPLGAPPPSGYGDDGAPVVASSDKGVNVPATVVQFSRAFDRVGDVEVTLHRLIHEETLVTISTTKRTYYQMALVDVTAPRDQPHAGDAYKFTIDASAVRVAETQLIGSPEPREPRGRSGSSSGAQESQEEGSGNGRNQSVASRLVDAREAYTQSRDNGGTSEEALAAAGEIMGF